LGLNLFNRWKEKGVASTTGACRIGRKRVAIDEPNPENLGQRLRGMSNPELLLFGMTTKCRRFLETSPDQVAAARPRELFAGGFRIGET
jgi:hypothetical protein